MAGRFKMKVIMALGLMAFMMTACASSNEDSTPAEYQPITFSGQTATAKERAQCEAVGGQVQRAGKQGHDHCIQDLPDTGQTCLNQSECLGRCVLPSGADENLMPGTKISGLCEATDKVFGCTALVNGGIYEGTLCVD